MPAPGDNGTTSVIFNMFRVQDGKLAEHWDSTNPSMMPGGLRGSGGPPGASEKPR
jgi:predicted SnoaL-like aldol condensation-catalyzing enzyme